MAGNHETSCTITDECSELSRLRDENFFLKQKLDGGKGKPCPNCNSKMVSLTSKQLRVCDCNYSEPFKLKPKDKSVLIDGLVGGIE